MQLFYKYQSLLYKIILFLAMILCVVYLFPRGGGFKYAFQKGKPWQYETLLAPFDFPVAKSQQEIEVEKKTVQEESPLIFRFDSSAQSLSQQSTSSWIGQQLSSKDSISTLQLWDSYLKNLYLPAMVDIDFAARKSKPVLLIQNNQAESFLFADLNTNDSLPLSGSSMILDSLLSRSANQLVLTDMLKPNVVYDSVLTRQKLEESFSMILPTRGMVASGERIIAQGEVVNDRSFRVLTSLQQEYQTELWSDSNVNWIITGYVFLSAIVLLLLYLFLWRFRPMLYENNTKVTFVFVNILLIIFMIKLALSFDLEYIYAVPLCIIPLLLKTFFDARLALFAYVMGLLLVGFMVPNSFSFVFMQLVAGVLATLTVSNIYKRANLFISAGFIVLIYQVSNLSFHLVTEGSFSSLNSTRIGLIFINGLGILFVHPLVYIFEKVFGLVSDLSLLELSDTNTKLLRDLSDHAPGTFHHSLQVANLAEAAANEIGANALLVRVGALYHDIGKMKNPIYFSENQAANYNPHHELASEESASIILNHIIDGIEIAKKNKLPDRVIDFIRTHHGTSLVRYFYHQAKQIDDEVDEQMFSYKGPKPFSKETAILMMSDSVEAASKSLQEPTSILINEFVEKIIQGQIDDRQFVEANINLREIEQVKKVLVEKLINVYHVREVYPT
jgi:putative nucleotidyltransferase with HDIG domain